MSCWEMADNLFSEVEEECDNARWRMCDGMKPQNSCNWKAMVDEHWGKKIRDWQTVERVISTKGRKEDKWSLEWNKCWEKDDEKADHLTHLRWSCNVENLEPHWQGKFKHFSSRKLATVVNLEHQLVLCHFQRNTFSQCDDVGQSCNGWSIGWQSLGVDHLRTRMNDGSFRMQWKQSGCEAIETWGSNQMLPGKHQIIFVHFCCICIAHIAEIIVVRMAPLIGIDAKAQWKGLEDVLQGMNNVRIHIPKFNFSCAMKRLAKHKLAIEDSISRDHTSSLNLHAVALIGADGSELHAVSGQMDF